MNKKSILLIVVALIFVISPYAFADKPKNIDTQEKQQETISNYIQEGYEDVLKAYNKMIVGYNTENMDTVLETIADRDDVVFFGTGSRYMLLGKDDIKEAFKQDFKNINNLNISIPSITIQGEGDIAWLNSILDLIFNSNDKPHEVIGRHTIVFKKYGNDWKIVSSHFSFSSSENDKVMNEIQQTEVNQAKKFKQQ
ncbi:MAG: nuclear transport factor 2 family protein [Cyanobacteriota bacterium]